MACQVPAGREPPFFNVYGHTISSGRFAERLQKLLDTSQCVSHQGRVVGVEELSDALHQHVTLGF